MTTSSFQTKTNNKFDSDISSASDESVLALSLQRPGVLEILIDRYQEAFIRKAVQIVRSVEDAQDVVQDTFTKIYLHAGRFQKQEGASFKSWAYKILINTAISRYQRKKREFGTVPLTEELEAVLPDRSLRQFEKFELGEYVQSVFSRMSEPFRRVLELYFLEGKNQQEIAELEDSTVGAIKTRMHRAKKEFREIEYNLMKQE